MTRNLRVAFLVMGLIVGILGITQGAFWEGLGFIIGFSSGVILMKIPERPPTKRTRREGE